MLVGFLGLRNIANGKSLRGYWRNYTELSPIAEGPGNESARILWTFTDLRKSGWQRAGNLIFGTIKAAQEIF
jgi:hypothetical protein